MESNKLQALDKKLPLRAYPEQNLNRVLVMDFLPFISNLLSLTDKSSADRLELTLPAIKEQCIGMGFDEIKRMFEMYADGKMKIQPIPNYFDRILVGKIVNEFKTLNRQPKKTEEMYISDDEQIFIMKKAINEGRQEWLKNGKMSNPSSRYDCLDEQGLIQAGLKLTDREWEVKKGEIYKEVKEQMKAKARAKKIHSYLEKIQTKDFLRDLENKRSGAVIAACKRRFLIEYYEQK